MTAYSARYEAALVLASHAHRAQTRKGSDTPYVAHPIHVSTILLRYGFPEQVVIAGLLHDVVEDQDVSLECIEAEFGAAVAGLVAAVSERKQENGVTRAWRVRKDEALAHLAEASAEAAALKTADVLHNARSLCAHLRDAGDLAWEHYSWGPEETLWYYRGVLALARSHLGEHPLVDEAEQAVRDLETAMTAGASV